MRCLKFVLCRYPLSANHAWNTIRSGHDFCTLFKNNFVATLCVDHFWSHISWQFLFFKMRNFLQLENKTAFRNTRGKLWQTNFYQNGFIYWCLVTEKVLYLVANFSCNCSTCFSWTLCGANLSIGVTRGQCLVKHQDIFCGEQLPCFLLPISVFVWEFCFC